MRICVKIISNNESTVLQPHLVAGVIVSNPDAFKTKSFWQTHTHTHTHTYTHTHTHTHTQTRTHVRWKFIIIIVSIFYVLWWSPSAVKCNVFVHHHGYQMLFKLFCNFCKKKIKKSKIIVLNEVFCTLNWWSIREILY